MEPGPVPGYLEESESEDEDVSRCILCAAKIPYCLLRRHLRLHHLVTTSHKFILDACIATEEQKKIFVNCVNNPKVEISIL